MFWSTLTVTGLLTDQHAWFCRARRAADMRRRAVPTDGCESVRFKERRGREIFGELSMHRSVYCTAAVFNRIIVRGVGDFLKKVRTLSSIVSFF